jgi:hypothetical protein
MSTNEISNKTIPNTNVTHTLYKSNVSNSRKYIRDINYIHNELRHQIEVLATTPELKSQIELYECMPYSVRQFKRWKAKIVETSLTLSLQEKISEILEARLVKSGYTARNWPFIIFLLKNNHGYQDTRNIENDTNVTFNVTRGTIGSVGRGKKRIKATLTPDR